MEKNKAFTLAETLIVLVVLGIIATLVIPNLINKQRETTQRTKVKKAMAVYETAVNKMILENNRSFSGLNEAGCDKTVSHFKYIKRDAEDGCIFETSDKIWWDVTDIQRPIISFKEITKQNKGDIKTAANNKDDKTAYVMVARFDDQGILRVNDLGYESGTGHSVKVDGFESKDQVAKLYNFINNVKTTSGGEDGNGGTFGIADTRVECHGDEGEGWVLCNKYVTIQTPNGNTKEVYYTSCEGPSEAEVKACLTNETSTRGSDPYEDPIIDEESDGTKKLYSCDYTSTEVSSCKVIREQGTLPNGIDYLCDNEGNCVFDGDTTTDDGVHISCSADTTIGTYDLYGDCMYDFDVEGYTVQGNGCTPAGPEGSGISNNCGGSGMIFAYNDNDGYVDMSYYGDPENCIAVIYDDEEPYYHELSGCNLKTNTCSHKDGVELDTPYSFY